METAFDLSANHELLRKGCKLSTKSWAWVENTQPAVRSVEGARAALAAISETASLRHLVVGVIGPRDATEAEYDIACRLGEELGALGVTVICGGKSGVMEAVCRGVDAAGGLAIGVLPGHAPQEANDFVSIPLPTGLSEARNMVIAKSARVLIAVGGSYGTLTEVAYGLHFSKVVIGLENAPLVDGMTKASSVKDAIELAAAALIASAEPAPQVGAMS